MREYSLEIMENLTGRSVGFSFDNDGGCEFLTVKTIKQNPKTGDLESTMVSLDKDDVEAIIEFLQTFTSEYYTSKREKGA